MKFCVECGAKNEDHAKFCCACGVAMSADVSAPTVNTTAQKKDPDIPSAVLDVDTERNYRTLFHIPNSEHIITVIGNSFLENILLGNNIKNTVAVATNRRLYYQGREIMMEGHAGREIVSGSVLLKDITYTGLRHHNALFRKILLVVIGGFCALGTVNEIFMAIHSILTGNFGEFFANLFGGAFWGAICGGLYLFYKRGKTTSFIVNFPGGKLSFDAWAYSIEESTDFQEKLTRLVDQAKG